MPEDARCVFDYDHAPRLASKSTVKYSSRLSETSYDMEATSSALSRIVWFWRDRSCQNATALEPRAQALGSRGKTHATQSLLRLLVHVKRIHGRPLLGKAQAIASRTIQSRAQASPPASVLTLLSGIGSQSTGLRYVVRAAHLNRFVQENIHDMSYLDSAADSTPCHRPTGNRIQEHTGQSPLCTSAQLTSFHNVRCPVVVPCLRQNAYEGGRPRGVACVLILRLWNGMTLCHSVGATATLSTCCDSCISHSGMQCDPR
ncbi:hypothetical protein C8Q73DRAFT_44964 [Cubamyces lactineus]|nr:hypothetical protein C8Q73DRAFT_44964 [Cubamyces lactineus]